MYEFVMKIRNISIISAGIIMLLLPVKASAFIIPKDLPTITHSPAQGHKEGRGQGSDKSGHKLWRAVAH